MSEVQPAIRARTFSYPAYGAIAALEAIDARQAARAGERSERPARAPIDSRVGSSHRFAQLGEAAEREFELARLMRIARVNRHAEIEE